MKTHINLFLINKNPNQETILQIRLTRNGQMRINRQQHEA